MIKFARFGLIGVTSALFVGFAASPSQALVVHTAECAATGSQGSLITTGWDYNDFGIPNLTMTVRDTGADGHHVQIRLLVGYADTTDYLKWHYDYDGAGSSTVVNSYVPAGGGQIADVGIEVATYEGSSLVSHCISWV
ncbi:hypothetical protein [Streptomyces hokutonensis]|uniref:hypothetical protein n=1 Tax=Streptomyces hokutonensis TaxID=1306990 RepID=UPI00369E94C8